MPVFLYSLIIYESAISDYESLFFFALLEKIFSFLQLLFFLDLDFLYPILLFFNFLTQVFVMLREELMVLEKVELTSSSKQGIFVDGLDELCLMIFYFGKLVELFFGLVDTLFKV